MKCSDNFDYNTASLNEDFDFGAIDLPDTENPSLSDVGLTIENTCLEPLLQKIQEHGGSMLPVFNSYNRHPLKPLESKDLFYVYIKNIDTLIITPQKDIVARLNSTDLLNMPRLNGITTPLDFFQLYGCGFQERLSDKDWTRGVYSHGAPTIALEKAKVIMACFIEHCVPGYFSDPYCPAFVSTAAMTKSQDNYILDNKHWWCCSHGNKHKGIIPPMTIIYEPGKAVIESLKFLKKCGYNFKTIMNYQVPEFFWP